jgi:formylglycine-generating enzyme required for sulfatase activity
MHGNVSEWCLDYYYDNFYSNGATDPLCTSGSSRVVRGGTWYDYAQYCRSASRGSNDPAYLFNGNGIGFRLALVPVQ